MDYVSCVSYFLFLKIKLFFHRHTIRRNMEKPRFQNKRDRELLESRMDAVSMLSFLLTEKYLNVNCS
jgi:hypothetical protein